MRHKFVTSAVAVSLVGFAARAFAATSAKEFIELCRWSGSRRA